MNQGPFIAPLGLKSGQPSVWTPYGHGCSSQLSPVLVGALLLFFTVTGVCIWVCAHTHGSRF